VIRVNLLPQKREARASGGQAWIFVVLGVAALELLVVMLFHQSKVEELQRQKTTNNELTSQIDQIKKAVSNHDAIKAQLDALRAREDAIDKLQTARSGPTAVLLEVARILTRGMMPTVDPDKLQQLRKDNPLAVPNPMWDARRLWITSYEEIDRTVRISGLARDGDDVSELARRFTLSDYFSDVRLLSGERMTDPNGLDVNRFELQMKAKY
jgi:type IV pilus assembly protein PilN